MLLTISVLMTGCEELHKKPLAYIETNADDRQSETSETETKKKKEKLGGRKSEAKDNKSNIGNVNVNMYE